MPAAVQQRQVAVQTTRHINRLLARSAPGRMDGVAGADPSEESSAAGTPAGAQLAAENAASPEEALLADGGAAGELPAVGEGVGNGTRLVAWLGLQSPADLVVPPTVALACMAGVQY